MSVEAERADEEAAGGGTGGRLPTVRVGAVLAVAVAAAVVLWLALGGGSTGTGPQTRAARHARAALARPVVASMSEHRLIAWAGALHTRIYWAGPAQDFTYQLTASPNTLYISYLPPGVVARAGRPLRTYMFVGTFVLPKAYSDTSAVAARPSSVRIPVPRDEVAFYYRAYPDTAYVSFKGSHYQIEVFDPDPARVRRLISAGAIRPVG